MADIPNHVFTVLVQFDIGPVQLKILIEALKSFLSGFVSRQPGFVSAKLHVSSDQSKLFSYVQWASEEEFEKFMSIAETHPVGAFLRLAKPRFHLLSTAYQYPRKQELREHAKNDAAI